MEVSTICSQGPANSRWDFEKLRFRRLPSRYVLRAVYNDRELSALITTCEISLALRAANADFLWLITTENFYPRRMQRITSDPTLESMRMRTATELGAGDITSCDFDQLADNDK